MMRDNLPKLIILLLAVSLGLADNLAAQENERTLHGDWIVQYSDREFGVVSGRADIVAHHNKGTIVYRHPETGARHTLTASSMKTTHNGVGMTVEGPSPSARNDGLGWPEDHIIVEQPVPQLTVRAGDNSASVEIKPLLNTDIDRVEASLTWKSDTLLTGTWRYRVHPFIGRDLRGLGRAGDLQQDAQGQWWAEGSVVWRRPKPQIYGVVTIEDQLAHESFSDGTSSPYYPAPYADPEKKIGRSRNLFVFGRYLPRNAASQATFETAHYAYAGEFVRVQVVTSQKLPVDAVPVLVGVDGKPLLFGDGEGIPALRSEGDPRMYWTDLIRLDPTLKPGTAVEPTTGGGWNRVAARHGSQLFARIGKPGLISVEPPIGETTVFSGPLDTAVGGGWDRWLRRAAEGAGVDTAKLAGAKEKKSDWISTFLINKGEYDIAFPGWLNAEVTLGHHAAMLLLRDTYVRMMERSRAELGHLSGDEELLAFRRYIEPAIRQGNTALDRVEVTGLDGQPTSFEWTFEQANMGKLYDRETDDAKLERDDELEFARASARVLGMGRVKRAEERTRSWAFVVGQLLPEVTLATFGVIIDIPEAFDAFQTGLRLRRISDGRRAVLEMGDVPDVAARTAPRMAQHEDAVSDALDQVRRTQAEQAESLPDGTPADQAPVTSLDESLETHPDTQPLQLRFDDLSDYVEEAGEQAVLDTFAMLDNADPSALGEAVEEAAESLRRGIAETLGDAAQHYSEESLTELRRLIVNRNRQDVVDLFRQGGRRVAQQLEAGEETRARIARKVLAYEPGLNAEQFEQAVQRRVAHEPQPQPQQYYDQASHARREITDALDNAGWHAKHHGSAGDPNAHMDKITDPNGNNGELIRSYDPKTKTFTMSLAKRQPSGGPPMAGAIRDVLPRPLGGNAVPAMDFYTMQIMHRVGIKHADGATLETVKMSSIANLATIAKLDWMLRTFYPGRAIEDVPEQALQELLLQTASVQYARRVLAGAGFRVTGARLATEGGRYGGQTVPLDVYLDWFQSGTESAEEFLRRHGLDPDAEAFSSFSIILHVEPWI